MSAIEYPKRGADPPSGPWTTSTCGSTRARWSAWSASPAPARPPSAAPPSALLPVVEGKLTVDGRDIIGANAKRAASRSASEVGIVFQDPGSSLNPRLADR